MPERTSNPYRRDRAVIGGMERHRAWDQGYSAAQADQAAWLASDEAVERVARTLYAIQRFGDGSRAATEGALLFQAEDGDTRASYRFKARAVLAALRGDGDV